MYYQYVTILYIEVVMAHRVNFMLDDEIWDELQDIPKGERSKLVNHAVGNELQACRRKKAMQEMDRLRVEMPPVSGTSEEWIREDRDHH